MRAGDPGAYVDQLVGSHGQAMGYAEAAAARGEDAIRADSALPHEWPGTTPAKPIPGNPVKEMNVYPVPPGTPHLTSGIAPQPESAPGRPFEVLPGGGAQTQLPQGVLNANKKYGDVTPSLGTVPIETRTGQPAPTHGPPLFEGDIGPDVDRAIEGIQQQPSFELDTSGAPLSGAVPEHNIVNLPEGTGPLPELDTSGRPLSGPPQEHNVVDLPEATGRPPLLDMPQADPRLLSPEARPYFTEMESRGREFHEGGSMSRLADRAEGPISMGGTVADTKDMVSLAHTLLDEEQATATGGRPGAGAYGQVQGEGGEEMSGEDLAEARADAELNVEPVNPAYPEPPGSEADLARMEDDIETILAERAQAEADAAEMEASACLAEENQSTAEGVAGQTSSIAGPAAQAHAAAVARREAAQQGAAGRS